MPTKNYELTPPRAVESTVNRDEDGEVLGAALFLGEEELRHLDVGSADRFAYWVESDGTVQVSVPGDDDT
jgi:hypothetical protein